MKWMGGATMKLIRGAMKWRLGGGYDMDGGGLWN